MGCCCTPKIKQQEQKQQETTIDNSKQQQIQQQETIENIQTPQTQEQLQASVGKYVNKEDVIKQMDGIKPCFQQLIYNLLDPKQKEKVSSDLYELLCQLIHNEKQSQQEINVMNIICEIEYSINKIITQQVLENLFKLDQQTLPKELVGKKFTNSQEDKEKFLELLQDYIMEFEIY